MVSPPVGASTDWDQCISISVVELWSIPIKTRAQFTRNQRPGRAGDLVLQLKYSIDSHLKNSLNKTLEKDRHSRWRHGGSLLPWVPSGSLVYKVFTRCWIIHRVTLLSTGWEICEPVALELFLGNPCSQLRETDMRIVGWPRSPGPSPGPSMLYMLGHVWFFFSDICWHPFGFSVIPTWH